MSQDAYAKLLCEKPRIITATRTANWNSGVATSGLAGADLVTIGTAGQWCRISECVLILTDFAAITHLTIRYFLTLCGAERRMQDDIWACDGTDGQAALLGYFWEMELFGTMRAEVFSDQAADDGVVANYEYRIKSW
jgi:hypothetical protein